jgi:hypothetical protein
MTPVVAKGRKPKKKEQKLPAYPKDHKVGMGVPVGGSDCDKCEYLKAPQTCVESHFIKWNGSDTIPIKTDRFCCEFFEAK